MARPPLPVGTMGEIRCYPLGRNRIRATAKYRDHDGVTRRIERTARSETAARNRLREACRDRGRADTASEITPDTTVRAVAEQWFNGVSRRIESGERSPTTGQAYRDRLDNQVIPALGGLRLREITTSRVDRFLAAVTDRNGASVAKLTRTVLNGVLGLAVRHDAIPTNPVRDAGHIRGASKEASALSLVEVWDLRAKLAADSQAIGWDLPEFTDMMMATGLRIGETAAMTWESLDLDAGTVEVRGTVVRITGKGLHIKPEPKSKNGWRIIELSSWAIAMLRRRQSECLANDWDVVFPSPAGHLRDPSNTQADLRVVLDRAGYPDVTSHTFRRTVATLMDHAGLSARAAADQLGHAKVSMTTDRYFGRRVASTGAAAVLEALDQQNKSK